MLPLGHPDRIHVAFDDHRLVALHLGLPALVDGTWTWATRRVRPHRDCHVAAAPRNDSDNPLSLNGRGLG